jgi:hypothetical protein
MLLGILISVICMVILVYVLARRKTEVVLRRPALFTLLAVGILGGGATATHIYRWHSPHGSARHEAFKRKIADICTQSALRVYKKQSALTPK